MRSIFVALVSVLVGVGAEAKTRIAVSTFTDKTGSSSRCRVHWWASNQIGEGFRDQIVTALMKDGKYEVVERENLKTMYNEEHELINADKTTAPKKNKFKAAHYSITGAVTSLEVCNSGIGGKADIGGLFGFKDAGLKVGGSTEKAKVVLDLRVIDVTTGQVMASFKAEGTASSTKITAEGDIKGSEIGSEGFYSTPIGEATRDAIEDAVSKIASNVPEKQDEVVAQADQPTGEQPVARASDVGRPKQSSATSKVEASQVKVNHICSYKHVVELQGLGWIHNGESAVDCKPLRLSATGKRVTVIFLNDAKEQLVDTNKIMNVEPLKETPKVGQRVFARGTKRFSVACKVIDTDGSTVIAMCGNKEITTNINQLFQVLPFKMPVERVAASQN